MTSVQAQARAVDRDPRSLVDEKVNIPENYRKTAGLELKALFTNSSFEDDLASYAKVKLKLNIWQPFLFHKILFSIVFVLGY